jgi:hypothetical protein
VALVRQRPDLTLVPPAALRLTLAMADGSGLKTDGARSLGHQPSMSHKLPAISHRKGAGRSSGAAPSWWTARALEGEVKPGFTKAEMQRTAKVDPRAPGGVFERIGGLLSDLLDRR